MEHDEHYIEIYCSGHKVGCVLGWNFAEALSSLPRDREINPREAQHAKEQEAERRYIAAATARPLSIRMAEILASLPPHNHLITVSMHRMGAKDRVAKFTFINYIQIPQTIPHEFRSSETGYYYAGRIDNPEYYPSGGIKADSAQNLTPKLAIAIRDTLAHLFKANDPQNGYAPGEN